MLGVFLSFLFSIVGFAGESTPPCLDHGKVLAVQNDSVRKWKTSTPNQFLARARVHGRISKLYVDKNGHNHFQIEMDAGKPDTLEVIYNQDFGSLPKLAVGMEIEACGDYITSNAPTPKYPASPDGAIIHWIHRSRDVKKHDSGYLQIDGSVYGNRPGKEQLDLALISAPEKGLYSCVRGNEESICDQELILRGGRLTALSVEYVGWCGSMGPYTYGCNSKGCSDGTGKGIVITFQSSRGYHWENQQYGFHCDFKKKK
jgi:hypothetical protein